MTNDTKYTSTMTGIVKSISSLLTCDTKFKAIFLATQALDFLMTEDSDYIVTSTSGEMTNDIKL